MKKNLWKVVDSEDSEEFIEKNNAKKSLNYKNMWIQIYKEVLRVLSIDKNADYVKWVTELRIRFFISSEMSSHSVKT